MGSQSTQSTQNTQNTQNTANNIIANPNDIMFAALTISLALSGGRSRYEVETLINLCTLVNNNLQAVLAQMIINDKSASLLDVRL